MINDIGEDAGVAIAEATTGMAGAARFIGDEPVELAPSEGLSVVDLLTEEPPVGALPAAPVPMKNLLSNELREQPVLGDDESANAMVDPVGALSPPVEASVAPTRDRDGGRAEDVAADSHDAGAADDQASGTPTSESGRPDMTPAGAGDSGAADVVSPAALVAALLETVAPRRNKRRSSRDMQAQSDGAAQVDDSAAPVDAVAEVDGDGSGSAVTDPSLLEECILPLAVLPTPMVDEEHPLWREQWPMNEMRLVGRLLARSSDAPALDGVLRTRMELALVEQHGDEFGSMGTLPIFVMPGALGFTSIAADIRRARKEKRRLAPITVEVQGILRQLPDRDGRYATERYRVLMGVEAHRITRVADDTEQFAYWRGRATVTASRRYEYRGIPYQRVTAVVELKQRKPRLRGTSITHLPVDFLVAPAHEHADRFEHIGQRLLIEATITPETQRMNDNHPDLEGIDDPRRKAQLQVLRESIVSVTMGEFPDEAAEGAYRAWVKAGRPRPERRGRAPRSMAPAQPAPVAATDSVPDRTTAPRRDRQQVSSSGAGEQKRPNRA